jgi:hypothetical protein
VARDRVRVRGTHPVIRVDRRGAIRSQGGPAARGVVRVDVIEKGSKYRTRGWLIGYKGKRTK